MKKYKLEVVLTEEEIQTLWHTECDDFRIEQFERFKFYAGSILQLNGNKMRFCDYTYQAKLIMKYLELQGKKSATYIDICSRWEDKLQFVVIDYN